MNVDYISITKRLDKDNISLDQLDSKDVFRNNHYQFILKGVNPLDVYLSNDGSQVILSGSIPYFWKGHNFHFSRIDFIDAINYASDSIGTNFMDADVNKFEFGSTLEIPINPNDFLLHHYSMAGMKTRIFQSISRQLEGKYFEDSILKYKLYDSGKKMKYALPKDIRNQLEQQNGYCNDRHYIRIESHYKKPQIQFKLSSIKLHEILTLDFMNDSKNDLLKSYKMIKKTKITRRPGNKKDINSGTIPIDVLMDFEDVIMQYSGKNIEDLLKEKIKSYPDGLLNKDDKKARAKQLKENYKKIVSGDQCNYDISSIIEAKPID